MTSRFLPKLALGVSAFASSAFAVELDGAIFNLSEGNKMYKLEGPLTDELKEALKKEPQCATESLPKTGDVKASFEADNFSNLKNFRYSLKTCETPEKCAKAMREKITFMEDACENAELVERYTAWLNQGFEMLLEDLYRFEKLAMSKLTPSDKEKIAAMQSELDTTCRDCCCAWAIVTSVVAATIGASIGTYYGVLACYGEDCCSTSPFGMCDSCCCDEGKAAVAEDKEQMKEMDQVLHTIGLHHDPEHPEADGKGWSPLYVYFMVAALCFTLAFVAFKVYERRRYNGTNLNNGVRNVRAGEWESDDDFESEDETFYGEKSIYEDEAL